MRIRNATRGTRLASSAWLADSLWSRLVGLLGRASLGQGEALVLRPCNSVHTAFMRFAIDVLYLDRSNRVLKVVPTLKPFRLSFTAGAYTVIELPPGVIEQTTTAIGDEITIEG